MPSRAEPARDPLARTAERSELYRRLAGAFRYPADGAETLLDLPPCSTEAGAAYLEAFDPAASLRACSLHESAYGSLEAPSLFEELVRFYAFFGLERDESAELPDHLCVELEFMHFLTYLEWRGRQRGEQVEPLRRAQHDFLVRHLSRLTAGIERSFQSEDPHLLALTALLQRTVQADLEELARDAPGLRQTGGSMPSSRAGTTVSRRCR